MIDFLAGLFDWQIVVVAIVAVLVVLRFYFLIRFVLRLLLWPFRWWSGRTAKKQ